MLANGGKCGGVSVRVASNETSNTVIFLSAGLNERCSLSLLCSRTLGKSRHSLSYIMGSQPANEASLELNVSASRQKLQHPPLFLYTICAHKHMRYKQIVTLLIIEMLSDVQ